MENNKGHLIFLFLILISLTNCKMENSNDLKETYTLVSNISYSDIIWQNI